MAIARFGPKTFEVGKGKIYTFDDFSYNIALETSKEDAQGKKAATIVKGAGLGKIELTAYLDAALGVKPRRELDEWEAIQAAAVAYPFVLGTSAFGLNKYLLKSMKFAKVSIGAAGQILAGSLTLSFEEYLPPGAQASAAKGSSTTGAGGTATTRSAGSTAPGLSAADPYRVALTTAMEKAGNKREGGMLIGGALYR